MHAVLHPRRVASSMQFGRHFLRVYLRHRVLQRPSERILYLRAKETVTGADNHGIEQNCGISWHFHWGRVFEGHMDLDRRFVALHDGEQIATGRDNSVHIHSAATGKRLAMFHLDV